MAENSQTPYEFQNPLLNLYFLDPQRKKDKLEGLKIAQAIYRQQTSNDNSLNYFRARNARWIEILLWAKGSQQMKEFLDYMNVSDGNKAYVNIDMTQQRIAAQFVNTLVEAMAKNEFYPCVSAVDDGSIDEKEQRKNDALFRMYEQQTIQQLNQMSGINFEPANAYIPKDELSAQVYFELEDRLPKEIRFEKMLQKTMDDIKFQRILNRKGLYDMTVLNVEATKIEKLAPNKYTVRKCVPTNMIYNFFINDNGEYELSQIGEFYNLKVRDFRSKFGKSESNPDGLTEKEIFDFARLSSQKNIGVFNFQWNDQWNLLQFNQNRPYDDFSILVMDIEVDCGEDVYFVEKTDPYGKVNIEQKNGVPYQTKKKDGTIINQPKPDNVNIIQKRKNTWMRGVYVPYGDSMLYWGTPDIIISPYTEVYRTLSSYSINIPNNDGEYVPSLFERLLEPLREYTLTKLKRKQLIAKVKPSGIRIDVESARNLDLGSGNSIAWEEVVRIYDQTGNELWSSRGVNPNERELPPLSNTVQDVTIQKIVELTNVLAGIVGEMRMLVGVSVYLEGGDLGDRTAAKLAQGQVDNSNNVYGYVMNGHLELWEETCYKLTCLHWNDIVRSEPESQSDLINTRFDTKIKMKSTDYEKQQLEQDIQLWGKMPDAFGNPVLSPKDAFRLRNIENHKLAELYLANVWEENYQKSQQDKQRAEQANIQSQQATAQQAAQAQAAMQQEKLAQEKDLKEFEALKNKELAVVNGMFAIAAKGLPIPPILTSLVQQIIPNISIPLAMENKQMTDGIIAQAHDQIAHQYAQSQMQQGQNPQEEMQEQGAQQNPQEEQQEQIQPQQ